MSSVTTYRVVESTSADLLSKVIAAVTLYRGDRIISFKAVPDGKPDEMAEILHARVDKIDLNQPPVMVDLYDEDGRFFQVELEDKSAQVLFDIIA